MNYLFFDIEYASSNKGIHKICEFGYVVTDEKFNIKKRNNLIINPKITGEEWDYRVLRKILTRKKGEYEKSFPFNMHYKRICDIIKEADYVFGHSINGDAKALNDECLRYNLPSIDYKFYDIKLFFKEFKNYSKETSVLNILKDLGIAGEDKVHDAETDAINTMYCLKGIINELDLTVDDLIKLCPLSLDKNENYKVESMELSKLINEDKVISNLTNSENNYINKFSSNMKIFKMFIDNVKPNTEEERVLKDIRFSISINYEINNYRQMLNIIQMLCNKGAIYEKKASLSDIFVRYDSYDEDGNLKRCTKLNFVNEANKAGANIKIITFDELLEMLHISLQELDEMPMVSFDCLYRKDSIIKDVKYKKYFRENQLKEKVSKGTTFGDYLLEYNKKNKNV